MTEMPQDPFSAGELDDFLPMAHSAKRMYDAAILAGFTNEQAMEWMIRITSSMITTNMRQMQG